MNSYYLRNVYDDEEEKAEDDKKSDSNESDGSNVSNETELSDSDLFKIIPYPPTICSSVLEQKTILRLHLIECLITIKFNK